MFFVMVGQANAIPAFARQYHLSCNTCHVAYPKLKPFGEDFASNGYVLGGMQDRAYDDQVIDDVLNLFKRPPIAMRFMHYLDATVDFKNKNILADMKTPWIVKALTGGAIGENVNFYAYVIFEKGEAPFFEDAWVDIHNVLPFSIMIGQFQISDFMFPRELRLTRSDYYIYKLPSSTGYNLTYHRGVVLGFSDLNIGVVNGNGIEPANENGSYDNNNNKWYFAHYALPVDFQLGLFGLYGDGFDTLNNYVQIYRAGVDFARTFGNAHVFGQIMYGFDNSSSNSFYGGFLGVDYVKDDMNIISLLFNVIDAPTTSLFYASRKYTFSLTYSHYLYRNAKLLFETEYDFIKSTALFTFGADYAF